jgi:hypothetical protein
MIFTRYSTPFYIDRFILDASKALMQPPDCGICSVLNDRFSPSSYVPHPVSSMKTVFYSSAGISENTVFNLCHNQGNRYGTCIIYYITLYFYLLGVITFDYT